MATADALGRTAPAPGFATEKGVVARSPWQHAWSRFRRDKVGLGCSVFIFWLFALFICACGFGDLLEAIIFWQPIYRFAGLVKLITAVVSWATVLALVPTIPKALHLPGLAKLNAELRGEVDERRKVEAALRESEGKMTDLLASEREASRCRILSLR